MLLGNPAAGRNDPRVSVRAAVPADDPAISRLLEVGFGHGLTALDGELHSEQERSLLVELDDSPIGTLRVTRHGGDAGVYGFVIDPKWQGRGIGRDVLRRVCQQCRAEGALRVGLEVAVDNDRAFGLYTSIGFTEVTTEDYYDLPMR